MAFSFDKNIYIFGYGLVGKSCLRLLKKDISFNMDQVYIIDQDKEGLDQFIKEGGHIDHYYVHQIRKDNYLHIYKQLLNKGDVMFERFDATKNIIKSNHI